ncbi:hypothetical protein C8D88_1011883 [Lentzea atacamensis]|uniref:Uncharacterized protein n=1 Tax=Lentzea atacamensis TaxID=531938 RepID=A0A316IEJ9_9PSEU|nr:hypothetical protein [Lentzea atacamensis]PWK91842.1 hypothetical protein C8D88_1011883 [Lentzea atacamensis]
MPSDGPTISPNMLTTSHTTNEIATAARGTNPTASIATAPTTSAGGTCSNAAVMCRTTVSTAINAISVNATSAIFHLIRPGSVGAVSWPVNAVSAALPATSRAKASAASGVGNRPVYWRDTLSTTPAINTTQDVSTTRSRRSRNRDMQQKLHSFHKPVNTQRLAGRPEGIFSTGRNGSPAL